MTQTKTQQPPDGTAKFLIVFGLGWTVFALIFVMIGVLVIRGETELYNQLINEGRDARAIITKLTIDNSEESPGYYVSYKFEAPVNGDPTTFSNTSNVSEGLYRSLKLDQRIDVIYSARDPNIVRLKSQALQPNTTAGWFFSGLGGLFLLVGLAIGISGLIARFRRSNK